MKYSELIKILKENNCYFLKSGSRHDEWYSPITEKWFPVPRHKGEMAKGTVNSIFKDAGIK